MLRKILLWLSLTTGLSAQTATVPWSSYGHDPQHTALSTIGAQRLEKIKWSTPVDLTLSGNTGSIFIHYGSPLITAANTVIVPVRTTTSNNYRVEAHSGATGALIYTLSTDYRPPSETWIAPYVPTLSQGTRLYYGGAGGTVYYRDQIDSATGPSGQIAFYGNSVYAANQSDFNNSVLISTPITADANGNIYFGFLVTGSNQAGLTSGLARIGADGTGSWTSASAAAQGDTSINQVAPNCAPAISNDGTLVYFGVSNGSSGYLVSVNSSTLAPVGRTPLIDPETKANAAILDESTASPTLGPDNDVYYGVFETSCCSNHDRGWLLHFDSTLTVSKTPGAFGWDDTASIVPATLVASYTGASSYLLFTKYNNYYQTGGNGQNKIALLDPNAPMTDPITGATVMQEVLTAVGPTPNGGNGVREWCINSGAIDPFAASAMANSEDGTLYQWSFATNSLAQGVALTSGIGEAYTPTAIGADGNAYAINNAILFAVGQASNMTIAVSDSGNFMQGENGATYTLTATNSGSAATLGTVTVSDIVPAGVTATAIGGSGWSCTAPAGPCMRSDSIGAGVSYPAITLTVNVAANAPGSVTNVANVSSDGAMHSVNSTASDVASVLSPVLSITSTHSGNFTQAQTGATYTLTVSNAAGAAPTSGTVTVTETLPTGLNLVSMTGNGWNCPNTGTTCTRSDSLQPGQSYLAITVTVNVNRSAPPVLTNQVSVSSGTSSANGADPTTIIAIPFALTSVGVPAATQYLSYLTFLTAQGGVPPYTWSVVTSGGNGLPEGMSLDPATGIVSATQVVGQGGYAVTIQVADSTTPTPNVQSKVINFPVYSDTSTAGCQIFPPDSIFNQRIDRLPVDLNPEHQIPSGYLASPIHPDFGQGYYPGPGGIPWMRVPANQPLSNVNNQGGGVIDQAGIYQWPFPAWPNVAVEGTSYGQGGGDHSILILQTSTNDIVGPQTGPCTLYESYSTDPVPTMYDSSTNTWSLGAAVHYNLGSNEIADSIYDLDQGTQDSAGVPIMPLLLRYSEVPLGTHHPLRMTFPSPTSWYAWPGTGCCANTGPPQGLLYRLKAGVNWQNTCPVSSNPQAATLLQALQQYGAYMSDHGATGFVQGVPDARWDDSDLACIKKFSVADLEVVDNSSLEVSTVSGQTKPYVAPATLPVFAVGTAYAASISEVGGNPAFLQWSVSSGTLPTGLSLDPVAGTLGGTPTSSAGSPYIFGITVTDTASGYSSAERQFALGTTTPLLPYLLVVPSHVGVYQAAETVTLSINVLNNGTAPTSGTITVADTLPTGATATAISGTGWTCTLATVTCTRSDALAAGGSYPLTVTAYLSYFVQYLTSNVATVTGSGQTDTASDILQTRQSVGVGVTSTHTGNFTQGQTGAIYTITVSNIGPYPTSSPVSVADTLPAGLTATAISGDNWSCTLATLTCSRSDVLNPATSYPPVTVTVNVSLTAGNPVINQVAVSGGGVASTQDTTTIVSAGPASQTITFGPLTSVAYGSGTVTLTATATSGLPVSFSLTSGPCMLSTATVMLTGVGTCVFQATQAGDNVNWAAATPVSANLAITQGTQTINFGSLPNAAFGASPTVGATSNSGLTVSFNSQTGSICTVSGSTVTLVTVGTCTIQATLGASTNWAAATPVNQSFTVTQGTQTINFGALPNAAFGTSPTVSATANSGQTVSFNSQTGSICTVSGSTVTLVTVGTCTIQATLGASTNWAAATPVNQSFTVTQGTQTINFGALPNAAFGVSPTVSATSNSGQTVSFNSQTGSICTVSGSTVTLVTVGTCTIQATLGASTNWAAATPVSQSFTVTQGTQTINFGALPNASFGTSPTVSATANSGLAVSFNSQTGSICTVSGSTVTLVTVGTCTIQATLSASTNWAAASPVNQSFTVTQGTQTINFGALPNAAFGVSPTVSATSNSGQTVSFNSQTGSICTVSGSTVTLVTVGTCTIQATLGASTNWAAATPVNQSFTVTQGTQTINFGALPNAAFGTSPTVSATANSGQTVSFNSQTGSICTVSGSTVTLVTVGTCTIQATLGASTNWAAATPVNQSFTVTQGTQTINFGALPTASFGASPTVSATANSGQSVSFNSQTGSICTVSGSTVTLVTVGTCTIQATLGASTNWAAATPVNQSFTVTQGTQTINFGALPNAAFGTSPTVSATSNSGQSVSFNSQTGSICTVSGSTVTLVTVGTCTIQATLGASTNWAAATPVNQSFTVTQGTQTINFGALPNAAFGASPTVSATANSGLTVSFNSQTGSICTVSGSTVTLVTVGTCTIQATLGASTNWAAATPVNQSFTVTQGTQTINFGALPNAAFGTSPTVSATSNSGQSVSFNSQTGSICTVSGSTVTLVTVGTCTIQATLGASTNWAAATPVNQSFTVTQGTQTISFGALPNASFGTSPTVSATSNSGQTVSFNSQTGSICTVSGSTVTLVTVSTCTIQATLGASTNWAAASPVNQSFTVTAASQTISFGPLANQALGAAPFTVSASASSGLGVSFTSSTPSVCTVSSTTVTLSAIGSCAIQAAQPGNADYGSAQPVTQTFTVTAGIATPGGSSLSFANTMVGKSSAIQTVTLQNTGNAALTISSIAIVGADAANYQYGADSAHPCPLSPATLAAGTSCVLDLAFAPASQGAHPNAQITIADNSGNVAGATQSIGLSGAGIVLSSISITANSGSLAYNNNEQFTATGTYSDTSTAGLTNQVVWASSATGVATIAAGGIATAVAVGQAALTATLSGVTSNSFQLTVVAGTPSSISVSSGSGQSAYVGTAFGTVLQALVKDGGGDLAPNASVTFTAPANGAGGTFANGAASYTAVTNNSGVATSLVLTANSTAGSFAVTAAVSGVPANATFSLTNVPLPSLTISKSHIGSFAQGQVSATYVVTVTNALGAGPTAGTVRVTENVPNGLRLIGMSGGTSWNCSVLPSCTTNSVLNPGSSYPAISVTVSVDNNAASVLTNQVTVSGGGTTSTASFSDVTAIAPVSACDANRDGSTNVADIQRLVGEALGTLAPVHDLNGDGVAGIADLSIVLNAALGGTCHGSLPD